VPKGFRFRSPEISLFAGKPVKAFDFRRFDFIISLFREIWETLHKAFIFSRVPVP
jgi:hypothetical protein